MAVRIEMDMPKSCLECKFAVRRDVWNDNAGGYMSYKKCPFQTEKYETLFAIEEDHKSVAKKGEDWDKWRLYENITCPLKECE